MLGSGPLFERVGRVDAAEGGGVEVRLVRVEGEVHLVVRDAFQGVTATVLLDGERARRLGLLMVGAAAALRVVPGEESGTEPG